MHASTARRLRKQAFRAIPAQPFAERREDDQLPGAIEVQLLRNCGNSFHERADAHERRLYLPRLEMRGREAQESLANPGFIASNGDSRHPTAEFRVNGSLGLQFAKRSESESPCDPGVQTSPRTVPKRNPKSSKTIPAVSSDFASNRSEAKSHRINNL